MTILRIPALLRRTIRHANSLDDAEKGLGDTLCPTFSHPCPLHPEDPCRAELDGCDGALGRIKVTVGTAENQQVFQVNRGLLTHFSGYFKTALGGDYSVEARTGAFNFPEDDPAEFGHFVRWLYTCSSCKWWPDYDPKHKCVRGGAAKSWCHAEPERDFVLGDRFLCQGYCVFALAHFVQHAHLAGPDRLAWICENTLPRSALHCFVRHWIAWIKFRAVGVKAGQSGVEEYADLFGRVEGWSCVDPRKYALIHWSKECGRNVHATCSHWRSIQPRQRRFQEPAPSGRLKTWLERGSRTVIFVWHFSPLAFFVLASYILARDTHGLLPMGAKALGVVFAPASLVGVVTLWSHAPKPAVVTIALGLASMMYSVYAAGICRSSSLGLESNICKLGVAFPCLQLFYLVLLSVLTVMTFMQS